MSWEIILNIAKVIIWPLLGATSWLWWRIARLEKEIALLDMKVNNLPNHKDNKQVLIAIEKLEGKMATLATKVDAVKEAVIRHEDAIKEAGK